MNVESVTPEQLLGAPPPAAAVPTPPAPKPEPVEPPAEPDENAEFDDKGNPFDPERHLHTKHPLTGVWMPKRRKREIPADPETAPSPSYVAPDEPEQPEPTVPPSPDSVSVTAETCIGIIQTALVMLAADEGVLSPSEKTLLRQPLERVLRKHAVGEMPPELDLAVAIAVIAINRLKKPKTQARLERIRLWWASKRTNWRARSRAATVARHAEVPSVDDVHRSRTPQADEE